MGWTGGSLKFPSNLNHSIISMKYSVFDLSVCWKHWFGMKRTMARLRVRGREVESQNHWVGRDPQDHQGPTPVHFGNQFFSFLALSPPHHSCFSLSYFFWQFHTSAARSHSGGKNRVGEGGVCERKPFHLYFPNKIWIFFEELKKNLAAKNINKSLLSANPWWELGWNVPEWLIPGQPFAFLDGNLSSADFLVFSNLPVRRCFLCGLR